MTIEPEPSILRIEQTLSGPLPRCVANDRRGVYSEHGRTVGRLFLNPPQDILVPRCEVERTQMQGIPTELQRSKARCAVHPPEIDAKEYQSFQYPERGSVTR